MISYRLKQDIVADTVREWIMEGKYRPGDQLPTDSDLSEMFQMNRRTIGIGLNQLVSENILERAAPWNSREEIIGTSSEQCGGACCGIRRRCLQRDGAPAQFAASGAWALSCASE